MGVKYHSECLLAERFRVFPKSVPRRGGVSPGATALLRVRFRSSRRLAGLTPCVSLTHHAQSHSPMDDTAHAPCRTRIRLAPSIGAARMDRAKTPTQSGLVTRIGGEERPTGGEGACLPVCREAITPCSPSRPPRVASPRARERVSHGPDGCAFGVAKTIHTGNSACDNSEEMT